jgi:hypothetical protein
MGSSLEASKKPCFGFAPRCASQKCQALNQLNRFGLRSVAIPERRDLMTDALEPGSGKPGKKIARAEDKLLLSRQEAAALLSISQRSLRLSDCEQGFDDKTYRIKSSDSGARSPSICPCRSPGTFRRLSGRSPVNAALPASPHTHAAQDRASRQLFDCAPVQDERTA